MKTFFENLVSSVGLFGIILITLLVVGILYILFQKRFPKTRFGTRDIVVFPLIGFALWLIIWALTSLGAVVGWIKEMSSAIASNLESKWWTALLVITIITIILDLVIPRKKKPGEEKESLVARWDKWKHKFYFAILWSIVILILNLFLSHLEIEAWRDLWTYKGTGTWFFSMVMVLLVASMVLIVNVKMIAMRWCGGILLFFALASWTYVAWTTEAAVEEKRNTLVKEWRQEILRSNSTVIPKGSPPVEISMSYIKGISAVPVMVRLNKEGEFKLYEPGTVEKPGPLYYLPSHVKVIEIKSEEHDIEIFYKTD